MVYLPTFTNQVNVGKYTIVPWILWDKTLKIDSWKMIHFLSIRGFRKKSCISNHWVRRLRRTFPLDFLEVPPYPICSMYGIFTYFWLKFMVNVGKYTRHGGNCLQLF